MTQTAEIITTQTIEETASNQNLPEGSKVMCFLPVGPDRKITRKVHEYYEISYGIEMTADGKGGFTFPDGSLMPDVGFYYDPERGKNGEVLVDSGLHSDRKLRDYFQMHGRKYYSKVWIK